MADEQNHVSDELDEHKAKIDNWAKSVAALPVPLSRKGVNDRFVKDCQTLVAYIDGVESPSTPDMCDFDDRTAALEIQYHQITDLNS